MPCSCYTVGQVSGRISKVYSVFFVSSSNPDSPGRYPFQGSLICVARHWRLVDARRQHAHGHTHTHLLRHILSNYWCGMHRTCKDNTVKPNRNYIYIYIVTSQLRTTAPRDCHSSAQLRPPLKGLPSRATACRYVYTGPGGVSSLATDPPGTPVAPCRLEVLHLFRWYTHTPRRSGADEMMMKMRWRWKWDESYLTRTRRGERKRRGKEQTPTRHT